MSDQGTLNRIAKGAGLLGIGIVASKAISYFYRSVVAQHLGPEMYGSLSLGISVASFAVAVAMAGVPGGIQNFVSKYRSKEQEKDVAGIYRSALHLSMPLSFASAALMFIFADFIATRVFSSPDLAFLLRIFALTVPFEVFSQISIHTTLGFNTAKYEVLVNKIGQNLVQLVSTLVLLVLGFELAGAAYGWLAGTIFAAFAGYVAAKKLLPDAEPRLQHRELFNYSYPLFLSGIIGTALGWTDTYLLGILGTERMVGIYNVAFPTAILINMPYEALNALALPSLSKIVEEKKEELESTVQSLSRWTMSLTTPVFSLLFLFSDNIITLLFSGQYVTEKIFFAGISASKAGWSLKILAFGFLVSTSLGHLSDLVKATSETSLIFKNTVGILLANLALNVLLIPRYGIIGASIATASSNIVGSILITGETYYLEKVLPISIDGFKPLLAAFGSSLVVYSIWEVLFEVAPLWSMVPGLALFCALYLVGMLSLRSFKPEDRELIIGAGRKTGFEDEAETIADLLVR